MNSDEQPKRYPPQPRPKTPPTDPPRYWYRTQERAMAPGIADGWPETIPAPHTPHGRLKRVEGDPEQEIEQLRTSLAAANKRAEKAEHLAAVHKNAAGISSGISRGFLNDIERVKQIALGYVKERDEARTQLAEARELLEQAYPFIGWAGAPDGLADKCHDFVARLTQDNNKENTDE